MFSYDVLGIILNFLTCTNLSNAQNNHKEYYYFNLHFIDEEKRHRKDEFKVI